MVITHEMDVVRSIADRVAHLDHGRIVEQGTVADVVRRSDSALSRALLPMPPVPDDAGHRVWTVRYEDAAVSPVWLAQAGREAWTPTSPCSPPSSRRRGRPRSDGSPSASTRSLDDRRVVDVLGRHGLVAEPADRAVLRAVPTTAGAEGAA
ncbi:hypothetical protein [Nocardioides convexus]|uniref:hypothetical protein n=1 Tax=Nocardioides convexus TaxID=2712224 RepID=UPI002418279F|nr:hypothetical protein [Nocardioides convexus]